MGNKRHHNAVLFYDYTVSIALVSEECIKAGKYIRRKWYKEEGCNSIYYNQYGYSEGI